MGLLQTVPMLYYLFSLIDLAIRSAVSQLPLRHTGFASYTFIKHSPCFVRLVLGDTKAGITSDSLDDERALAEQGGSAERSFFTLLFLNQDLLLFQGCYGVTGISKVYLSRLPNFQKIEKSVTLSQIRSGGFIDKCRHRPHCC